MATVTANAAQATVSPKGMRAGLVAVTGFYSIVGSISIGTTIQMVKVPQGATPVFIQFGQNNAGQASMSVGDGINNARYYANTTVSAAMGMIVCGGSTYTVAAPYTYSTDDTIDIFVSLVSVTTIGGAYYLTAIFSMDVQPSGTAVGILGGVAG